MLMQNLYGETLYFDMLLYCTSLHVPNSMLKNEPYLALNSNMNHSAHGRGVPGPGPGSQTRVFKQLDPPDPGPFRPGVFGIPNWNHYKTVPL